MSEYSHATDLTPLRMGLPFWRGDTSMELGPVRDGRAWGFGCWTLGALALAFAGAAQAKTDEREKVEILYETTLNLIRLLVEQGVIKQEVADEMIRKAEAKAKASRPQAHEKNAQPESVEPKKGEVRVTYVP